MNSKKEMSLVGHLDELRKRLTVIIAVNLVGAVLMFNQAERILDYFLSINPGMQLVYITPSELLTVYIQISLIMALVICSPVTVYQVWSFIKDGLYKNEKVYMLISLFFGVIFFVVGVLFCYLVVLPTTLQFFLRIAIEEIDSMISIKSYVSFINVMLVSFGLVFEMPVVVFLFTKLGIITPQSLVANRGVIIILVFIFAAFITPPDVISQIMLGLPMLILLELSIVISKIVYKGNKTMALQ